MKNGVVSIILPIYGVEAYLERCIQTVVAQTYPNIEIILVDDGSKDGCPTICDKWAEKDSRIKVIHKQNAGLGEARNTGIENATGEYICFFDSDDYIDVTTVEKLYHVARKNNPDAIIFGFNNVDKDGNVVGSSVPPSDVLVFEEEDVRQKFLPDLVAPQVESADIPRFYMSAWVFMYSMEYINKVNFRFVSERVIISEDVYSLLDFFKSVNKVCVLPEPLYYYCENGASLSRKYNPERYERIKHFYLESLELCESLNYSDEVKRRLARPYIGFILAALKQEVFSNPNKKEVKKNVKKNISDDVLQSVLKANRDDTVNMKKRIIYFTMRKKFSNLCYLLIRAKR